MLLDEHFDDADVAARGWFDATNVIIDTSGCQQGGCLRYHYAPGDVTPGGKGTLRIQFPESDVLFVRYYTKYSDTWKFRPSYGPHELYVLTNLDGKWIGPAETHLTGYIEHVEGRPTIAGQDTLNVDQSQIDVDLTQTTEQRGAHGCNGANDSYGKGDCYSAGSLYRNGKSFKPSGLTPVFTATPGPYFQGDWHEVIVELRLNTVTPTSTTQDGHVRYWFDGQPVIDIDDMVWRTGKNPTMRFNEFLIGPYYHGGAPQNQDWYIDELRIATTAGEVGLNSTPTDAGTGGQGTGGSPGTDAGAGGSPGIDAGVGGQAGGIGSGGSPGSDAGGTPAGGGDSSDDSGCSCRTPRNGSSPLGLGWLAALVVVAAGRVRRRTA